MARHQDDGTGRCELSEMLVGECAGCRGHLDPVVDQLLREGSHGDGPGWKKYDGDLTEPAPDAHPVTAQYHGECTALPKCRIQPGDLIIATRGGTWMHHPDCPAAKGWQK